jgi:hypothetical protein
MMTELITGMQDGPASIVRVSNTTAAVNVASKTVEATLFGEADAHRLTGSEQRGGDKGHGNVYKQDLSRIFSYRTIEN